MIDVLKLIVEILSMIACIIFNALVAIYKTIVPSDEESVAGEIVLVCIKLWKLFYIFHLNNLNNVVCIYTMKSDQEITRLYPGLNMFFKTNFILNRTFDNLLWTSTTLVVEGLDNKLGMNNYNRFEVLHKTYIQQKYQQLIFEKVFIVTMSLARFNRLKYNSLFGFWLNKSFIRFYLYSYVLAHHAKITGTGHGIGRETAQRYARAGAVLVCVDVNETGNKETVKLIESEGGKAYHFM